MESALANAYTIKINNFEGPFDLLFHLIEKNRMSIYDIQISEITDQYMDYLYAMQQLDLEIASEFLVMAATLLHIKSRMLLPEKKEKEEEEEDPREELVQKLLKFKKYKEFSEFLKEREKEWERVFYKLPEVIDTDFRTINLNMEFSATQLRDVYLALLERNRRKINKNANKVEQIIQHEKITLRSKIREILRVLVIKRFFRFSDIFNLKRRSRQEVVTGFLAILELAKLKKAKLDQKSQFSEITVYRWEKSDSGEDGRRQREIINA